MRCARSHRCLSAASLSVGNVYISAVPGSTTCNKVSLALKRRANDTAWFTATVDGGEKSTGTRTFVMRIAPPSTENVAPLIPKTVGRSVTAQSPTSRQHLGLQGVLTFADRERQSLMP